MTIDPGIEKILDLDFVRREAARHPAIERVTLSNLLYPLANTCGGWHPESKTIFLDANVDPEKICRAFNQKFPDLNLQPYESWIRTFFHECCHADGEKSDWTSDRVANECLLRWRKDREGKINLIFQNKLLIEG